VKVVSIPNGRFVENCYLVIDEARAECAIIDPGEEAGLIAHKVAAADVKPVAIWLTHAHIDHVLGVPRLKTDEGGERVRSPYAAAVRRGHPASGGAGDERQRAAALRPGRRHSDRGDLWIDGAGVRIRATRSARPGGRALGAAVSPVFRARAAALPPEAPSLHEVAHGG